MKKNELTETKLQIIWLFIAAGFGFLVGIKKDVVYWLELSSIGTLVSFTLICCVIKYAIQHKGFSGNLFTISFGACLFCSVSAFQLSNEIASGITFIFALGIGLLVLFWKDSDNQKRLLSEIYVIMFITVVCGYLTIVPTFILNHSPCACEHVSNSIFDLLDCTTHIFPLTLAVFLGLFIGVTKGYLILCNEPDLWKKPSFKRRLAIVFLSTIGLVFAYQLPRGWIEKFEITIAPGWFMVLLSIHYMLFIAILPVGALYLLRKKYKNIYIILTYLSLATIGGILQGSITAISRSHFQPDFKLSENFWAHISIDITSSLLIAIGLIISVSLLKKFIPEYLITSARVPRT